VSARWPGRPRSTPAPGQIAVEARERSQVHQIGGGHFGAIFGAIDCQGGLEVAAGLFVVAEVARHQTLVVVIGSDTAVSPTFSEAGWPGRKGRAPR
jgi:hypothetical protein